VVLVFLIPLLAQQLTTQVAVVVAVKAQETAAAQVV
jgi:hypothetical protein